MAPAELLHRLKGQGVRFWALSAFAVSALALALAYISQYGFGLHPCEMCLWQRLPYAVVMALALMAFSLRMRLLLWLCVLALAVGAGLGGFHAGVEWRWWAGPSACGGTLVGSLTPEQILEHIRGAAAVSCEEAALRVWGLSMAGWNALYSAGCAVVLAAGLRICKE